jgi:hypothetical protein
MSKTTISTRKAFSNPYSFPIALWHSFRIHSHKIQGGRLWYYYRPQIYDQCSTLAGTLHLVQPYGEDNQTLEVSALIAPLCSNLAYGQFRMQIAWLLSQR